MNSEINYHINPKIPFPGMLAIFIPVSESQIVSELELSRTYQNYLVRAVVSENIPLSFNVTEFIKRDSSSLLVVKENPLTLTMHHGGYNAIFYDLVPKENGDLSHIEVEIKAQYPADCLATARTIVNQFLDRLMREMWLPLSIIRLDIFLKGRDTPLMHQLVFPFNTRMQIGPLGGYDAFPLFSSYEALIREAIHSTSPYYRFLCAYRLNDGISHLRSEIKKLCANHGVTTKLPKRPKIDPTVLLDFGFNKEFADKIDSMDKLESEFTNWRTSVAHFLTKNPEEPPLNFSQGDNYRTYSLGSAVLLFYAHQSFTDLFVYFNQNLSGHVSRGSVLAEKEDRDKFVIKANSFRNSFTDKQ
ncbi:MAG: hypothetical protein ACKVRN_12500 [Pyrinomonadaceae bacterium]